uniref:Uncharacterized protein n=1 Tax=Mimivirus LCMiAC01 TaxID=2506608 RepID=A0A481YZ82_9VIRU|nr:MAG: hypothetical protein LCMiAC01_02400 [Mimivirus LCMiAC01]
MNIIVITILIVLIAVIILYKQPNVIEGLNTFNGRMAVDDQYYFDKLFDNVIYYHNTYNEDYSSGEDIGKLVKTGWQECREKCPGHCVEFGVSSHTHCFLPHGVNSIATT